MTLQYLPARRITAGDRREAVRRAPGQGTTPAELFVRDVGRRGDKQIAGVAQSTVFLHGLGGTHRYWTAADGESHLPPDSTLVDLLGFGRSPRPLTRYTLETHLAALEPVLARRTPSVLIGHSLGATLALAYAARHPADVRALVLISLPAYGGPKSAVRWQRRRLRGWFLTNMALTALVCVVTRRILGPILPRIVRDVPPEVARDLVEHNFMSATTSLWNVLYRHDLASDLEALPADLPITFIHGVDDATAPIDPIRRLVERRSGRQLLELPGVDHHPWLRRPSECAELIATTGAIEGLTSMVRKDGWRNSPAALKEQIHRHHAPEPVGRTALLTGPAPDLSGARPTRTKGIDCDYKRSHHA